MSIIARLREKSWETPGANYRDPWEYRPEAVRVGLWVYLGVATVLFAIMTAAYLMRMGDHTAGGRSSDWHSMPLPNLLWINTIVLVAAGIVWEAARIAARREWTAWMRRALVAGGALGFVFLAGQILVWRELHDEGYFLAGSSFCLSQWGALDQPLHITSANPALAFFTMITAIHGLHIGGGLVAWGRAIARAASGIDVARIVGLSATYWHFLLIVWLAMFGLLLST